MTPELAAKAQALAGLGLPRSAVAALVDGFFPGLLSADERRFLAGPLVVHDSPWNDARPRWLDDLVGAERVGIVLGLTPGLIVGPAELVAVMHGASLDGPLSRECSDLYVWGTIAANARRFGVHPMAIYHKQEIEPIRDEDVTAPRGRLHHEYSRLASEIRRRVVAAQAQRERQKRAPGPILDSKINPCHNKGATKANNEVIGVQTDFFG